MDAERFLEIVGAAAREQLDQVLQVDEAVVDRRGRQQEELFSFRQVEQLPMPRRLAIGDALHADVAEVVRLVDDHDVGFALQHGQLLGPLAAALQVGVVDDHQVREVAEQMRQVPFEGELPHRLPA